MKIKTCPKCGAKMLYVRKNEVLLTYPPQYPMQYWCGCGYWENAGMVTRLKGKSLMEAWEELNSIKPSEATSQEASEKE